MFEWNNQIKDSLLKSEPDKEWLDSWKSKVQMVPKSQVPCKKCCKKMNIYDCIVDFQFVFFSQQMFQDKTWIKIPKQTFFKL